MGLSEEFIGQLQMQMGTTLQVHSILVPARNIAQIIAGFANTQGGYLIFGARQSPVGKIVVTGLSADFKVLAMLHKAMDMLQPIPEIEYQYFTHEDVQLFGIKVYQSEDHIMLDGAIYARFDTVVGNRSHPIRRIEKSRFSRISELVRIVKEAEENATSSKKKFLNHYYHILQLFDQGEETLFPEGFQKISSRQEGIVLGRILFASCMDTFETYLSDLLYEIYLAEPNTLKNGEATVKVVDVLECADRDEVISMLAARKVRSLQKGSVKGFIEKNKEIAALDTISKDDIEELEKVLQIRHLYTHRNGIVDESFLMYFKGQYELNSEHRLSADQIFDKLTFIVEVVSKIDIKAIDKYHLSTTES